MQLRIAFTGTHSTGKTTLLNACKAHFNSTLHSIEDIPRSLIAKGLPMGTHATVDSLVAYTRDQFRAERVVPPTSAVVISNRTCIDSVAYAKANSKLHLPSALPESFIEMLEEVAVRDSNYYSFQVYFPIEFSAEPDPVRPPEEEYRIAVDYYIAKFIEDFSVPCLKVSGTVKERMETLLRKLSAQGLAT